MRPFVFALPANFSFGVARRATPRIAVGFKLRDRVKVVRYLAITARILSFDAVFHKINEARNRSISGESERKTEAGPFNFALCPLLPIRELFFQCIIRDHPGYNKSCRKSHAVSISDGGETASTGRKAAKRHTGVHAPAIVWKQHKCQQQLGPRSLIKSSASPRLSP